MPAIAAGSLGSSGSSLSERHGEEAPPTLKDVLAKTSSCIWAGHWESTSLCLSLLTGRVGVHVATWGELGPGLHEDCRLRSQACLD